MAIHGSRAGRRSASKARLANYVRKQQRDDGSFRVVEGSDETPKDVEAVQVFPGVALYGLMLSQRHRPAAWKSDAARKALPYYSAWWKANPNMACVPMLSAAFAEAYLLTKEPAFATCVFDMTDWVCGLQYAKGDDRNPAGGGGFKGFADGKAVLEAPTVQSAAFLEGLAQACRVTRQVPDATRYERYRDAAANACQFLTGLQFTEDTTRHFAPNHRPLLFGGFTRRTRTAICASPRTGTRRGMIQFLTFAADR